MLKGDGHSGENRDTFSLNPSQSVGVPLIFFRLWVTICLRVGCQEISGTKAYIILKHSYGVIDNDLQSIVA